MSLVEHASFTQPDHGPQIEVVSGAGALAVLSLISRGGTENQIARDLEVSKQGIRYAKGTLRSLFGTPSLAAVVHRAIQQAYLPIEIAPNPTVVDQLAPADPSVLAFYALGGSNRQIARKTNQCLPAIEQYHDRLLKRIGAWSRPHAIRRAHELGILKPSN